MSLGMQAVGGESPAKVAAREVSRQFWRRMIFGAVAEAKRTRWGLPTDDAIVARWWLEYRPNRQDFEEWERSFEHACERLGRDADVLRAHLLTQVDGCLKRSYEDYAQRVVYVRRAMVLACAGLPTAIGRQLQMPLADPDSYEHVAGIDHGDQYALYDEREVCEAA